jgi:hypothetical protein
MDILAVLVALVAFIIAWLERLRAMKAEKRIEKTQNRAYFATFRLADDAFNSLTEAGFGNRFWSAAHGTLLCGFRNEISPQTPAGTWIALLLKREAKHNLDVTLQLEKTHIKFFPKLQIDGEFPNELCILEYEFDPKLFGKTQTLEVSMQYQDLKRTDRYQLEHGRRVFQMIDFGG